MPRASLDPTGRELLAREHAGGVLADPLVGVARARLGHALDELGGHVLPAGERPQRDQAVPRVRALQRGVAAGERHSAHRRAAARRLGSGSRRMSSESSVRPQRLTCWSSASQLADRIVADGHERDRGIERELLVAAEDAEEVGVLAPAEPAHQAIAYLTSSR